MYISNCRIINYKGFRDSEQINLTAGFNVVVGPNNAGKTAFLEALGLQFQDNLNRSISKSPGGNSLVKMTLKIESHEAFKHIRKLGAFWITKNQGEISSPAIQYAQKYFSNNFDLKLDFNKGSFTKIELVDFKSNGNVNFSASINEHDSIIETGVQASGHISHVGMLLANTAKQRLYFFRAERLNIHQGQMGVNPLLTSNAGNLPEVLHLLQSSNRFRFQRFVDAARIVFPDIQDLSIAPISNSAAIINIWMIDPKTERKDLAIPLSDCGTGIGQVLAMLYVVINSDEPLTILIDEPQSFLHPGAIRKLFEIFKRKENARHQYIVTTHSPTVVTACGFCNVIMLYRQENETKAKSIDTNETDELRVFLSEIGARLSDVFGADKILWVEGRTEELCFPRIIQRVLKMELLATEIIGITQVGDLAGRQKKVILEIYQKLCQGRGLLPPALGFCFDREKLSESEIEQFQNDSCGLIKFIPRRMYESFLLNPKGIAAILNEIDVDKRLEITEKMIAESFSKNQKSSDYAEWVKSVDAAKLLKNVFNEVTEARVNYDKLKHGVRITDWIIDNSPSDFSELANFLKMILE